MKSVLDRRRGPAGHVARGRARPAGLAARGRRRPRRPDGARRPPRRSAADGRPRRRPPRPGPRGAVIIAVPDDAVGRAASELARAGGSWAGRDVFHTSGLLPAGVLAPLARRGARVASLHPVQAFPRKGAPASVFTGITWGIEGDEAAVEAGLAIVRALRGHVLLLAAKDKALYHAACALASNALVALEWTAAGVLGRAGSSRPRPPPRSCPFCKELYRT